MICSFIYESQFIGCLKHHVPVVEFYTLAAATSLTHLFNELFFFSFLSRGLDSIPLVVFYLKTLLAIDSEVVDRDIQRTKSVRFCTFQRVFECKLRFLADFRS